ncbi:MAG: hypothetical protein DCC59_03335 [Chloroflexi bacterium]|nr:hypothetical protein [Chloroflexi bacterium CFX1]MCK6567782.1 hypothetical protein [Anaerolineales bacterium]MCQ3952478.1 hypothetical protein [Chloroflexota bacterium]MDL1919731.1 hypothetical protein [Chloroflexi bacterium CFX5]NUQ58413.1 hypothetical protein [Anaerolineales bacterium]
MADKKKKGGISAGDNSVVVGGSVQGSNIVIGSNNTVTNNSVNIAPLFDELYRKLDIHQDLAPETKRDVKEELKEIQSALEAQQPDESFLARRFRNLKRMAPDIADIALETLKNPIGGVAEIIKKVAKKAAEEAG